MTNFVAGYFGGDGWLILLEAKKLRQRRMEGKEFDPNTLNIKRDPEVPTERANPDPTSI